MQEFFEFRDLHRPLVRPAGTAERVRRSLGLTEEYSSSFRHVRAVLRPEIRRWPEDLVLLISKHRDLSEKIDMATMQMFREMFEEHNRAVLASKFDDDYFRTIEDLTLFFIYLELRAVWMVGALKEVMSASIDRIFDFRATGRRSAIVTLFDFFALELSQVQRVYVRYAEVRFNKEFDPSGRLSIAS